MTVFKVQIVSHGGGHINRHVWADSAKQALLAAVQDIPEDNPAWQWPGWQVQVHPERYAFILETKQH